MRKKSFCYINYEYFEYCNDHNNPENKTLIHVIINNNDNMPD